MITTFSLGKERNETLASGRSKNETVTEILEKVGNLKQNPPADAPIAARSNSDSIQ